MVAETTDPERLVFVDEMGTNTSLSPTYAYSKRGERAYASVPRNRGPNTTLLSSMTVAGIGPAFAVVGATTKAVFETYVERVLAPSLESGQIVVLDNLAAHKGERVTEMVQARAASFCTCQPTRRTSIRSKSANHNAPSDINCSIIGVEGLLGLVALVERLEAAHISEQEEGQQCPEKQFPPVHSHQRALTSVEGASCGQSSAASSEPQPPAGVPARRIRDDVGGDGAS